MEDGFANAEHNAIEEEMKTRLRKEEKEKKLLEF